MVNNESLNISLAPLEEERFGIRSARAANITRGNLSQVIDFCQQNKVTLLIARCTATHLDAVQEMEHLGFFVADTLVYYGRSLATGILPAPDSPVVIRPLEKGEGSQVQAIAEEAFSNYISHYHQDKRLDRKKCNDVYGDWANEACFNRDESHEVLIALRNNEISAFATLRLNNPQQGEGVLFGIGRDAQGAGIYKLLMMAGMRWCADLHAQEMIVSTQIINVAVQKVWVRLGFEPQKYVYTLHKWFDRQSTL